MARCSTVFVPGDPARTGRVTFWRPGGSARTDAHAHREADFRQLAASHNRITEAACARIWNAVPPRPGP